MSFQSLFLKELFFSVLIITAIADRGIHLYKNYIIHAPHQNELCLGECYQAKNTSRDSIKIDWELSTDLDHSTREDVYRLRKRRVEERPELFKNNYFPTKTIFANIVDHLRWWGFDGYYQYLRKYRNRGELSSAGKSLRGEEIFNPFNLVTVIPWSYSVENPEFRWQSRAVPSAESGKCPLWPEKTAVTWKPAARQAEISYSMSTYAQMLVKNECITKDVETNKIRFALDPVNAQDLGLPFMAFSLDDSENIDFSELPPKVYRLNFFYHRGTSCGHKDGCNNISPLVKDFHNGKVKTTSLPASLVFNFWAKEPSSLDQKPDFQYRVFIE